MAAYPARSRLLAFLRKEIMQGEARPGVAGQGEARLGEAGRGWARQGKAGLGEARQGEVKNMTTKEISITIEGISPLLMHSFPMEEIKAIEKKSPAEQAEIAAYRDPDTKWLYVPGMAVQRALIAGATYSKGKGRASLQKPVAACVIISPERIPLDGDYVIDSRPVVVPATGGRIIRHRPKLPAWKISFEIEFDDELLKESELRQVVDDTGKKVGILDFRPEKKGPFGRFVVTKWEK